MESVIFQLHVCWGRLTEEPKGRNYWGDMGMYLKCLGTFDVYCLNTIVV